MVKNGLDAGETMNAHHFFMVQCTVRLPELCVPLVRNLTQLIVVCHCSSRSVNISSDNGLELASIGRMIEKPQDVWIKVY